MELDGVAGESEAKGDVDPHVDTRQHSWLDRRQPARRIVLGWLVATIIFVGFIAIFGGPSRGDAPESFYSTWAVEHGDFRCSYPPAVPNRVLPDYQVSSEVAPLWPLVSGGLAAIARIGHSAVFPPESALGSNCSKAIVAMFIWSEESLPVTLTTGLGYLSWFVLLVGIVVFLRAVGLRRQGWELAAVLLIAASPLVWAPILKFFHPQDIVAMGLALAGLACVKRDAWIWAGVWMGLAVSSQQFALLVLVPIVIIAPAAGRLKLIAASATTWMAVTLPVIAATHGQAVDGAVLGTGNSGGFGGTVLWELHLHGDPLVFFSRVMPLIVSAALAVWSRRRLGDRALDPVPLVSLVATSVSLRLVFEQNMYGYYFMAIVVMLIVLDVVRQRIRGETIVWIAVVTLAYVPIPYEIAYNARSWGANAAAALPVIYIAVALVLIAWDVYRHRFRWYLPASVVLVAAAVLHWPPWILHVRPDPVPDWIVQILLVGSGVALAFGPLLSSLRTPKAHSLQVTDEEMARLD